jgi:Concanavalin A-like lectin/glucanases superfamily/Cadherin-like domain
MKNNFDDLTHWGKLSRTLNDKLTSTKQTKRVVPLAGEISNDDLILHFNLNENSGTKATDSASDGENNQGELRNGAKFFNAGGQFSGAVAFDGVNDYIAVKDSKNLNLDTRAKRTISLWFNVKDKNLNNHQVLYEEGGSGRGLNIYIYKGRLYIGGWNNPTTESSWQQTYLSTDAIASNQWNHVAFVLDAQPGVKTLQADALTAYLNGTKIGTSQGSQVWSHGDDIGIGSINQSTQFHNGDAKGTATRAFGGNIDTVKVYNRALSAEEIDLLANRYPVAADDTATIASKTATTIAAADLLENDKDSDNDKLAIANVNNAVNGSVKLDETGNVVFTPNSSFRGEASFEYTVSDGRGGEDIAKVTIAAEPEPQADKRFEIGTNLLAISYFSTQLPFIDGFKSSKDWSTQTDGVWDTNEANFLNLDADGWVKSLPAPADAPQYTFVGTLLYREQGEYLYPGGKYVVLYEGEGNIEYSFDAKKDETASTSGRDVIDVTPSGAGIYLKITETDPNKNGNYLRDIRVVPLANENTYQQQIFNPDFIEKVDNYETLRFMDWMATNDSREMNWSDRPTLNDARYAGVPVETMVALSNRIDADPWFTMPHKATDDYITKFAEYVKANLEPGRTIYVEYTNEAWNPDYDQYDWLLEEARKEFPGSSENDFNLRLDYYSKRSTEVMRIWDDVFGSDKERVIGVLGPQGAFDLTGERMLQSAWTDNPLTNKEYGIDALGIAPYFGNYIGQPENQEQVLSWTKDADGGVGKLFDEITKGGVLQGPFAAPGGALQQSYDWIESYARIAQREDLLLLGAEAGQSVRGYRGTENNETITNLFLKANRDGRMKDVYKQYFQKWEDLGGDMVAHFNDVGRYDRFSSFGALEHINQPNSPKYDALLELIAQTT